MRLLPATNFGRLVLLIGVVLLTTLSLSLVVLREVSLNRGGEQIGNLLADQVVTSRILLALPEQPVGRAGSSTPVLDIRSQPEPPASAQPPMLLFVRQIESRLKMRLGESAELRIEESPESRIWIHDAPSGRWLGIASPPFRRQAVQLTLIVVGVAVLVVLLAAALYARSLSRPLERLAEAAGSIASGEFVPDPGSRRATRELQQLQAALQHAAEEVRHVGRERELLLAGVSHDVRTPLARLRLLHEMHPSGDGPADAAINRNVEEIDRLIGQFLDYARDGREEALSRIDLGELLTTLRDEARERDVAWQLQIEQSVWLRGRPIALTRAMRNLMRNAEVHGAAPYRLQLRERDGFAEVRLYDGGRGIPTAEWSRLQRPFQRGDQLDRAPGTGLGLAIASRVAANHGGQLKPEFTSAGFSLSLTLPISGAGESWKAG